MYARVLTAAALFASLFTFAGTAQAAPADTALVLSVQMSEVEGSELRVAWLDCGATDSHPRSGEACAALAAVRGNIAAMTPDHRPCTFIYAPVEVEMVGLWRGRWVSQSRTFPNSCVMAAHTGPVFDF